MNLQRDRSAWLHGPSQPCQVQPLHPERPRRLLLMGAPGVGKGTQAALLAAAFGACHLSTGDIFRHATLCDGASPSPFMLQAKQRMQAGELVPDELVLQLIRERIGCLTCRGGFILDGFPRTISQAAALEVLLHNEGLRLDAVISYELPAEELISRIVGRRTCPVCKAVFHLLSRPPRQAGTCDHCGGPLARREDDQPDAIRIRQRDHVLCTAPLLSYYAELGLVRHVDASGTPEEVFTRTVAALARQAPRG